MQGRATPARLPCRLPPLTPQRAAQMHATPRIFSTSRRSSRPLFRRERTNERTPPVSTTNTAVDLDTETRCRRFSFNKHAWATFSQHETYFAIEVKLPIYAGLSSLGSGNKCEAVPPHVPTKPTMNWPSTGYCWSGGGVVSYICASYRIQRPRLVAESGTQARRRIKVKLEYLPSLHDRSWGGKVNKRRPNKS